jgi:hypothetical protein
MEHLAMFETGDGFGTGTTWGEHVTDQDYNNTSPTETHEVRRNHS